MSPLLGSRTMVVIVRYGLGHILPCRESRIILYSAVSFPQLFGVSENLTCLLRAILGNLAGFG